MHDLHVPVLIFLWCGLTPLIFIQFKQDHNVGVDNTTKMFSWMIQENQETLAKLDDRPSNNWFKKALRHRISFLCLQMIESMDLTVDEFNAINDEDRFPGDGQKNNAGNGIVANDASNANDGNPGESNNADVGEPDSSSEDDMVIADLVRRRNPNGDNDERSRPHRRRRIWISLITNDKDTSVTILTVNS